MSIEYEPLQEGPAKIKVIGVGGGGGNAVNHMYRQGIHGVEFIVCNTDLKALESSPVPNKIILGRLGAGNVPERARKLALEHKDEIRQAIGNDTQMLFITAGMGGGTGTGAAPIIAEIAKSIELDDESVNRILVVAIVTEPFSFEGYIRRKQAMTGIEELRKHVDAILIINNDKLRNLGGNLPLKQAFSKADDVLLTAAKGIAEIITVSAYVNIDFRDVNTVMENSGTALMGAGEGSGEERARMAIEAATTSVLLNDNDIRGAQNILLYMSSSPEHPITMDELEEITNYITKLTGDNGANVIWGEGDDENLNDELRITLIATGFEPLPGRKVIQLEPEEKNEPTKKPEEPIAEKTIEKQPEDQIVIPADEDGIKVIRHAAEAATTTTAAAGAAHAGPISQPTAPTAQQPQPTSNIYDSDNPFNAVNANAEGKRVVKLYEATEPVADKVAEPEMKGAQPVAESTTGNSHIDEIKIFTKPTPAPEPQAETKREPIFHIEQTDLLEPETAPEPVRREEPKQEPDVWDIKPATPEEPTAPEQKEPKQKDNFYNRAIEAIHGRSSFGKSEKEVNDRAERIRRMNEMLHNDPDGPAKLERMTTEELSHNSIFETPLSSVSDAARMHFSPNGTIAVNQFNKINELPD